MSDKVKIIVSIVISLVLVGIGFYYPDELIWGIAISLLTGLCSILVFLVLSLFD